VDGDRIDVRRQPLVVRDGCAPDRTPGGRWPSDGVLVRSEQFAVNEALACLVPDGGESVIGMHAPPGTGVAEVFGDLVAAIVTERARRIADLPDPSAAFGDVLTWGSHTVTVPAEELAGFEIVQSAPGEKTPWIILGLAEGKHGAAGRLAAAERAAAARPGLTLPSVGARWRDRATRADYFASTARLSDGVGAWAMLVARLGDRPANRAFAERWWHGAVRGTDVLFPAGESMATALRQLKGKAIDWPSAVAWFRSSLGKVQLLTAERMRVAAALTRLSLLEQACEEASTAAEAAEARLAELTAREPAARDTVTTAEDDYRAALAILGAHEIGRPEMTTVTPTGVAALQSRGALSVALAGGIRRGRNWREWSVARRRLRAACAAAGQRWDSALREAEGLRGAVAEARTAAAATAAEVTRLTTEVEPLAETVASARQRWGDHVPAGPSQSETEDPALIEWRETTAPWADDEYAAARTQAFFAALELHKALIAAQPELFEANLAALMDLISADTRPAGAAQPAGSTGDTADADEPVPAEFRLAAWRSFFLTVPVVHVPFEVAGSLLAGLGPGALGWLLADGTDQLAAGQVASLLHWFDRAVLAEDTMLTEETALAHDTVLTDDTALAAGTVLAGDTVLAENLVLAEKTVLGEATGLTASTGHGASSGPAAGTGEPGQPGQATGVAVQELTGRKVRYGTWLRARPAGPSDGAEPRWVGMPLRVVRGQDRSTVDQRNDLAYDGLLIADRD
jgi:hypothetical protein